MRFNHGRLTRRMLAPVLFSISSTASNALDMSHGP